MGKDKIPRIRLNAEEFELIEQFRAIKETANEMDLNDADLEIFNKARNKHEEEKNVAEKMLQDLKDKYGEEHYNMIILGRIK